jgi:methylmalonyl-CoA mutase N-terminal domain/subunit
MKNRFGAKDPKSWMLRFHTQTGGSTLTAQQPENNVVRVAIQALAAVLGGTQSLHTNSMDEALWLPTEKSVRVALRTQQIIGYESGVADTIDPMAGSYVIEYLTNEIEAQAKKYIERIDNIGGALKAIEQGYLQNEIQDAAYQYQKQVENKENLVVGVNSFEIDENIELERLAVDPTIEKNQIAKLQKLKSTRDSSKVSELLTILENESKTQNNLMPLIVECVENDITLGEICGVLRKTWGEYQPEAWI